MGTWDKRDELSQLSPAHDPGRAGEGIYLHFTDKGAFPEGHSPGYIHLHTWGHPSCPAGHKLAHVLLRSALCGRTV